jgi:hypothetical protein
MKPEDEEPTEEELREAAALAAALEGDAPARPDGAPAPAGEAARTPPADALEAAALLRHARAPITVPPAHEPIAAAHVRPALDARGAKRRRRARVWIATSLLAPAAAAAWMLFATTLHRSAAPPVMPIAASAPPPPADLLAAQAEATRGGAQASAALAALDLKMRAYRRQYIDGLRRRGGGAP